ncbi:MAG: hypothetical protein IKS41_00775 [Alphaproteobacteria bacterium]|nr:hypothetical protein [Alphaproteobacteria bacterium]
MEEQNRIERYYASAAELEKLGIASPGVHGEALCTFRDPDRFKKYHIINAVRKDVDQIRREDFKGREQREDEYGTSVLSIQVLKEGGFISIKNRYNHTVDNPDNTLNSNPDRIILGLSNSIRHHFGTDFSAQKAILPEGYTFINGQIIRYNIEQENIYFGSNFYVKDGEIHHLKDHEIMMDSYIFDMRTKKLFSPSLATLWKPEWGPVPESEEPFIKEMEGHKVILKKDKEGQHIFIRKEGEKDPSKDVEIITVKDGTIIAMNLPTTTKIGDGFLMENRKLKSFTAPHLVKVGNSFLTSNTDVQNLDLSSLEYADFGFLTWNKRLTTLNLPQVRHIGDLSLIGNEILSELHAPKLEQVGDGFLENNHGLKTLSLPSLVKAGADFLSCNTGLISFSAPNLEKMDESALAANTALKTFYAPRLSDPAPFCLLSQHPDMITLWNRRTFPPETAGISAQLKPAANMGQGVMPAEKSVEPSDRQDASTLKRLRDWFLPQK